jgi:hypothetical protein
MSDNNNIFDPEKISIVDFKMVKGQVDTSEYFDPSKIEGYHLENGLQFGFSRDEKLVKADFTIDITTESKGQNQRESSGNFHFVFIYHVENWEELAKSNKNNLIKLHPTLSNALSSVTYSTSRGILLTRLQGTALQNFVLPIINPNTLLNNKDKD